MTDEELKRLYVDYELSLTAIARAAKCSHHVVRDRLAALEVPFREKGYQTPARKAAQAKLIVGPSYPKPRRNDDDGFIANLLRASPRGYPGGYLAGLYGEGAI